MTRLVILVITLLMISACGKVETPAVGAAGGVIGFSSLKGKVQLDGSSTVFPISEAVAEEFNNVAPAGQKTLMSRPCPIPVFQQICRLSLWH